MIEPGLSTSGDDGSEALPERGDLDILGSLETRGFQRVALASSAIRYAEYDPETRDMVVAFVNGQEYTHPDVSQEEFDAFTASSSPGRFWHGTFKGR